MRGAGMNSFGGLENLPVVMERLDASSYAVI